LGTGGSGGVADLPEHRFERAISEFRTALLYSRDNYSYQLNLAEALLGRVVHRCHAGGGRRWSAARSLVGMGVLLAGFLRAPMTSVFMVLEVSGNYSIIVPVIEANTFAYVISHA
jgi:hypothetical protein